jgi:hypothetical protein
MNPSSMQAAVMRAMMQQQANQNSQMPPSGETAPGAPTAAAGMGDQQVTPVNVSELRGDWNKYLDWLDKKGIKRDADLDKNATRYFNQYIKENPKTTLDIKYMPLIRSELERYRDYAVGTMKGGESMFPDYQEKKKFKNSQEAERGFMPAILKNSISEKPDLPGQYLTQHRFPGTKIITKDAKGNDIETIQDDYNDRSPNYKIEEYLAAPDKSKFINDQYTTYYASPEYQKKNYYNKKVNAANAYLYQDWKPTSDLVSTMRTEKQTQNNNTQP